MNANWKNPEELLNWLSEQGIVTEAHIRKFEDDKNGNIRRLASIFHALLCTKRHEPIIQVEGADILASPNICAWYSEEDLGSGPTLAKWETFTLSAIKGIESFDNTMDETIVPDIAIAMKVYMSLGTDCIQSLVDMYRRLI